MHRQYSRLQSLGPSSGGLSFLVQYHKFPVRVFCVRTPDVKACVGLAGELKDLSSGTLRGTPAAGLLFTESTTKTSPHSQGGCEGSNLPAADTLQSPGQSCK